MGLRPPGPRRGVEPGAQDGDQQQVQQPVENGLLARYVLVCTPAGFERYFARMAAEQAGEEPPEWAQQPIPDVERVGPQIELD